VFATTLPPVFYFQLVMLLFLIKILFNLKINKYYILHFTQSQIRSSRKADAEAEAAEAAAWTLHL
jgi:hypothetical protein